MQPNCYNKNHNARTDNSIVDIVFPAPRRRNSRGRRAVPLLAVVSGQGYCARHHATCTTAPLGSGIIRHHGHGPRLVDTVLHVLERHLLSDLRVARRYRLLGAAPVFVGTLLTMLQDRRRPLWPIVVVMTPCAVIAVMQVALPSIDLTTPNKVYGLFLVVGFIIYMLVAVRQYGRWLRDNYADLEHKEVWFSLTMLIGLVLLIMSYEYTDNYVMSTIAHLAGFPLAGLLLWRVETLKDLSIDSHASASELPSEACPSEHPAMAPCEAKNPFTKGMASHIGQLLAKHCEETQLYLQTDLTLSQLSVAVGVNRYYLSQYFTSQDTSYYEYIHDLRIGHFIARYREFAAAHEPIVAQQLARESGYHSYSTFSTAFKRRMHKSVTAWMGEEGLSIPSQ